MPNEEEIISFLNKARANEPDKFREYIEYYKKNHPSFYKKSLAPRFEEKPKNSEPEPVNPAEQLGSDIKPLGSANVGEEISMDKKEAPEIPSASPPQIMEEPPAMAAQPAQSTTTIERKKFPWKKVLIIAGIIIGLGIIGGLVYIFVLAP